MKKRSLFYILTALVLCLVFALAGCNNQTPSNNEPPENIAQYYTVTFDSQGGSNVESQSVREGNPVRRPTAPTRENYDFRGWYKQASALSAYEWNFDIDRVTAPITLYAGWDEIEQNDPQPTSTITFKKNGNAYTVTGVGENTTIIIPTEYEGLPVTAIGESAFSYARHKGDILSVAIPDSVTTIGLNAFHNRSELVTVNIGKGSKLQKIGNNAFSGNSSLKSIYLPETLTEIGNGAFNNCGALDAITVAAGNTAYSSEGNCLIEKATHTLIRGTNNTQIPASVTEIAAAAFRRATTMTSLTIPKTVMKIGNYFIADSAITTITYQGTKDEWKAVEKTNNWNYGNRNVTLKFAATESPTPEQPIADNKIFITIGSTVLTATLVENSATEELKERLKTAPITIDMSDYGGWEKVGGFGFSLPTSNSQITAQPCEFVLYQGNQLVIFYGSNSWSYTRLGKFDNVTQAELKEILGSGNITVTLSLTAD